MGAAVLAVLSSHTGTDGVSTLIFRFVHNFNPILLPADADSVNPDQIHALRTDCRIFVDSERFSRGRASQLANRLTWQTCPH